MQSRLAITTNRALLTTDWVLILLLSSTALASRMQDPEAYAHASIENAKTYTYIQHPVPVKGPNDRLEDEVKIPTFLTKKERKRLRKQAR